MYYSTFGNAALENATTAALAFMDSVEKGDLYDLTPDEFDLLLVHIFLAALPHDNMTDEDRAQAIECARTEVGNMLGPMLERDPQATKLRRMSRQTFSRIVDAALRGYGKALIPF